MLDALKQLFSSSGGSSSKVAEQRLKFVLLNDRANISPEIMEKIKNDIIQVISHYMEIDKDAMDISLENDAHSVALVANIPVNNMKHQGREKRRH